MTRNPPNVRRRDRTGGSPRPVELLSVLFVNYNSWRLCVEAIESLRENPPHRADGEPLPYQVIVVDNCSPARDADAEADLERVLAELSARPGCSGELVRHDENGGYAKGMNLACGRSRGDGVLICNPDVVFMPGCVDRLLRYLEEHPDAGAVVPEGFWDSALESRLPPNVLPTLGDLLAVFAASLFPRMARRYARRRTAVAVRIWTAEADVDLRMLSGCCFLMRRATIDEIGLFDERFPLYYEDTDLSVRLRRAGYRIVQVHGSRLVHLYNQSGQTANELAMERYYRSRRLYYHKWYGRLGAWLYDLTRAVQNSAWGRRRAAISPQPRIDDLGVHRAPPVIELSREYPRFLVEVALDPYFFLAAAMFGAGRRWTVGPTCFKGFGPATYYFRLVDLSDSRQEIIGVYRYTRIAWDAPEPETAPEGARVG